MAKYHIPNNHRASSSAFQWGRQVHTKYATGCLRKILIQSRGFEKDIDPKYGEVGAINEERHARLKAPQLPQNVMREAAFLREIKDGVTVTGHADFVLIDDDGRAYQVDELKSVQSKNTRRDVIRQGHWLPENLAQLVCYMVEFRVVCGRLIYTYWEKIADQWCALEERIFAVAIDEFGRIHVDSEPTKYTVQDLLAHQHLAAEVIATGKVAERPLLWDAPFVSPCAFCDFAKVCDDWDSGSIEGEETFVKFAMLCKKKDTKND